MSEEQPDPAEAETTPFSQERELEQAIDDATEAVSVQVSQLDELESGAAGGDAMGMGQLMDVPVRVTVQVGRSRLKLGELVQIRPGSLIELDREAHEPADILVNGKIVARGEIVTIDGRYGVRVASVEDARG
jgi:flagellar motor switch protein FliN/FliY